MAYKSWKELTSHEKEGIDYKVETKKERSNWSHVAPHGGRMERLSLELAKTVATERRQNYGALNVLASDPERLRINEIYYDAPWARDIVGRAQYAITYHSVVTPNKGDPDVFAYVSGLATAQRDQIIAGFKKLKIFAKVASNEGHSGEAGALVNRTKKKQGVRIELSRALREKLVVSGNINDTSKGYTKLWSDIVAMLAEVTGPADVYQSWAALSANEKEGVDYHIEMATPVSNWSHLAIHGGPIELLAREVAKACADERKQKYYAFVSSKKKYNDRLRIPDDKYDEPQCVKIQSSVQSSISYHGTGGDKPEVHIGGLDTDNVKKLTAALKAAGFVVTNKTTHGSGKAASDPKNICNRTKTKKGVHLELTRGLRDKMSATGNAGDLSKGTTPLLKKFAEAIATVTGALDVYQSWSTLTKVEKEGVDYRIEIARRGSSYAHLAIHGKPMELVAAELAKKASEIADQSYYALIGMKKRYNDRMIIPSVKYDEPKCVRLQSEVDHTISYHGIGDKTGDPKGGIIRVGGRQTAHRDKIVKALKAQGLAAEAIQQRQGMNAEAGGTHEGKDVHSDAANITNKNRMKAGVQIELSRAMRNSMSATGDAGDLSKGMSAVFDKFVKAVTSVTIDTDRHQSWTSFILNEKEGRDYEIHKCLNPESNVAHIAIHGGAAECLTADLAEEAAAPKKQNFYALVARNRFPQRIRMPSTLFSESAGAEVVRASQFVFSYHGCSDRPDEPAGGQVFVGGADTTYRDQVAAALRKKGFSVKIGGVEWGSDTPTGAVKVDNASAGNITNKGQLKAGVQLELTRALRNRMSSTGNACDENAAKTQVFRDFLGAVRSVAQKPDAPEQETGEQGCIRYYINNFNLDQPRLGFKLLKGTEYAPSISPRLLNLPVPGWHGQMPMWHDPIDTMKVSFVIQIRAATASKLRQRWDDFVGLCGVGKFTPVRLERYRGIFLSDDHSYDPHDRNRPFGEYVHARLESLSAPEFEAGNKMLTATAVFDCPAGVWRTHKIYYQYYTKTGGGQRCAVASASVAPVYEVIIRAQGGKNLNSWSIVDQQSNTGVAWTRPANVSLKEGNWVYASTETMQAYVGTTKDWPKENESFNAFIRRIKAKAAWHDYRYIRNGPLNLTSKSEWIAADPSKNIKAELARTSRVEISMTDANQKSVTGRELAIMARAARF
ncbi:poly-gamma-glutamate hydrolase family protein [Streptomyces sp. NPDC000927]|uniref:poly-gamma-glutamate hydrolase family protein n=1 Tax=Streptomyces sp. NPDC000927 TaxID=3154371 RepID=UPI00332714DB